ncbi:MAG: polysaccharide deacetylase family protein, partial [Candidatus Omnitrophica bacterium]|nr:polysaccharide deacetylase family protein [Candidatus Omnitrophota bacterium]
ETIMVDTMKMVVKSALFQTLLMVSIEKVFGVINGKMVVILMYHGVIEDRADLSCWWQLPYKNFVWQMCYLKEENYNVIHLKDLIRIMNSGESLPDRCVVLTFDDGYENNFTLAYPLLRALKLPATIFLTTDLIGTDTLLWSDEVFLYSSLNGLAEDPNSFKNMPSTKKNEILSHLRARFKADAALLDTHKYFKLLNWQQVDEMKASGWIDFGAHSCTHEILSQLDEPTLCYEIKNSCSRIGQLSKPVFFAFPNGRTEDYDARAIELLRESGVACALTAQRGLNSYNQDPFDMKRIAIGNKTSQAEFKLLCSGAIE